MSKVKFEIKQKGFSKFAKSQEMLELTKRYAEKYEGKKVPFIGFDRAKTLVYDDTHRGKDK